MALSSSQPAFNVASVASVASYFSLDSELQPSAFSLSEAAALGKSFDNAPAFWLLFASPQK
jgi:hypothetical protein